MTFFQPDFTLSFGKSIDGYLLLKLGLPFMAVILSYWWTNSRAEHRRLRLLASRSSRAAPPLSPSPSSSSASPRSAPCPPPARRPLCHLYRSQGLRSAMEDDQLILPDFSPCALPPCSLFGVFDGHGGAQAAHYAKTHLPALLAAGDPLSPGGGADAEALLRAAVERLEADYLRAARQDACEAGTSLALALVGGGQIAVANVGRCDAVVCRSGQAAVLSTPHTLQNADERRRVLECGGVVYKGRLGHPHLNYVLFNLDVTRSIGDPMYKDPEATAGKCSGLVAAAATQVWGLNDLDEFLILTTGGVLQTVDPQNLCNYIKSQMQAVPMDDHHGPQLILKRAIDQIRKSSDLKDNITILLIIFQR